MSDSDEAKKPSIMIFGRDVLKIPCYRNTFLYSMSSWVGVTLIAFLFTSKPKFSSHCGVASFITVSLCYYPVCRYKDLMITHELHMAQSPYNGFDNEKSKNKPKLDEA